MSKAVTKGAHWLPRAAQYSTHGQRNGRVDVLPADAKMPLFTDLQDRYERQKTIYKNAMAAYVAARDSLAEDPDYKRHMEFFHKNKDNQYIAMPSKFAKRLDEIKRLKDELGGAAARLQDFRSAFFEARDERYERAWINTAKLMLPWDVVGQIEDMVNDNLRRSVGKSEVQK